MNLHAVRKFRGKLYEVVLLVDFLHVLHLGIRISHKTFLVHELYLHAFLQIVETILRIIGELYLHFLRSLHLCYPIVHPMNVGRIISLVGESAIVHVDIAAAVHEMGGIGCCTHHPVFSWCWLHDKAV